MRNTGHSAWCIVSAQQRVAHKDNIVRKQGVDTGRCRNWPLPTPGTAGYQKLGGTCSAQRGKVLRGGGRLLCSPGWMGGILSPASGAAAAEPCPPRTIQGEAGRNVGTVPGAAASLRCWREVLSSQPGSFVAIPAQCSWPSQAGPRLGSQPSVPQAYRLENSGPSVGPGRRGKQTGRKKERLQLWGSCSPLAV